MDACGYVLFSSRHVWMRVDMYICGQDCKVRFFTTFCGFQKEEIKSLEQHVKKLLEMTPPKGKDFLDKVEHILEREKNWVRMFLISHYLLLRLFK